MTDFDNIQIEDSELFAQMEAMQELEGEENFLAEACADTMTAEQLDEMVDAMYLEYIADQL